MKIKSVRKYVRASASVLRNEGVLSFGIKGLQKLQQTKTRHSKVPTSKVRFISLVDRQSVMRADWSNNPYRPGSKKASAPYIINWVMSPPSGGGGHQNIFRFIEHLDGQGYKNNIYIYSTTDNMTLGQAKENVAAYCKAKDLTFTRYGKSMEQADAIFATGWETAYPVFNEKTDARKMYFVQDFEPYFYPMGTDYILAENTYRFGFYGITAGGWLSQKLTQEYGMRCDYYDFGAEPTLYHYNNKEERKEVFFYARPVTERRGFELGIMALQIFHERMPDYTINLAGWDVSDYDIPFPYANHKTMKLKELSDLYNRCATALVISLTNMSLLPLELLACGTIPVVNDGVNNRLVSNNKYISYTAASPAALAESMVAVVTRKDQLKYARDAAKSVEKNGWDGSLIKFEEILKRELR